MRTARRARATRRSRTATALARPCLRQNETKTGRLKSKRVVAGDHEQVVVETRTVDHELHVAIAAETVFVRVVPSSWTITSRPSAQARKPSACARSSRRDRLDLVDGGEAVDETVDDRAPATGRSSLAQVSCQRPQACRITAPRDDQRSRRDRPASGLLYGARCTPASVTIASISAAGVHVEGRVCAQQNAR